MDISIIIVNYRTADLCVNCVSSIKRVFESQDTTYEVILIDNASEDGSFEKLKYLEGDNIHVYATPYNGGFGYGNNRGVEFSSGEYLFFLNSDTVLYPDTIVDMWHYAKNNPEVGAIGCLMHDGGNNPLVTAHAFENTKTLFVQTIIKPLLPSIIKGKRANRFISNLVGIRDCDWISGAGLLLPKNVFNNIGGWNEKYFLYMEDEELCYRIHNAGYRVVLLPQFGLKHFVSMSGGSPFSAYERYKSKLMYFHDVNKKNYSFNRCILFIQARQYMRGMSHNERNKVMSKLRRIKYD